MGSGVGDNYKSRIRVREIGGYSTTSQVPDWKSSRMIQCLSQAEAMIYYILRWDDNNVEIYEQYALDNSKTTAIAEKLGYKHPWNSSHIMTTDFVAVEMDGTVHAYAVKADRDLDDRTKEILAIEEVYWKSMGAKFDIKYKSDVNIILYANILDVVAYYDPDSVSEQDPYSFIKHKIATKEYKCDMEHKILDAEELIKIWKENR